MNTLIRRVRARVFYLVLFVSVPFSDAVSQDSANSGLPQDSLGVVAREIITTARYCALITVDESGKPYARTMDPFLPEDNMTIWFGTNQKSRKVEHIRTNPDVVLYYFDSEGLGYVSIAGDARLVNDPEEKARRWKEEWRDFYPDREEGYLLIAVKPKHLEIVSIKHNITSKSDTWIPPTIGFKSSESKSKQ